MTRVGVGAIAVAALVVVACSGEDDVATGPDSFLVASDGGSEDARDAAADDVADTGADDVALEPDAAVDASEPDVDQPDAPLGPGFIGSPCLTAADCDFDGAVCLTDGFPGGTCTLPCALTCPDRDGYPVTFCVAEAELQGLPSIGDGACLSRCDFGAFADGGCRTGYGCVKVPRANEPGTVRYACLPNRESEMTACHSELVARGVSFEPTVVEDRSPDSHPGLICHVEDPVLLHSPVHGVELRNSGGTVTSKVLASCKGALAIISTVDDIAARGAIALRHMGTYNCRVIAGTSTLSQHAFGDAIDIAGVDLSDGTLFTVLNDWEHDTSSPVAPGAKFLYEAAHRWYDAYIWNIILTPNYNAAHDNHFHVDLSDGSHYLKLTDGRYIGPAPYVD